MAQLTANFALGTNGNAILAADPGSANAWDAVLTTGSGTVTYDNTHTTGYSPEMAKITLGGQAQTKWSTALGTVTDHYGRLYWYQTASGNFLDVLRMGSSGSFAAGLIADNNSSTKLALYDAGSTVQATSATTIPVNQLIRIEWHIIHSATVGQLEAKIFLTPDSSTPDETFATAATLNTLASANEILFGAVVDRGQSWWIGDVVANATAYPGPVPRTVGAFQ
jgi:hypothetical protein